MFAAPAAPIVGEAGQSRLLAVLPALDHIGTGAQVGAADEVMRPRVGLGGMFLGRHRIDDQRRELRGKRVQHQRRAVIQIELHGIRIDDFDLFRGMTDEAGKQVRRAEIGLNGARD